MRFTQANNDAIRRYGFAACLRAYVDRPAGIDARANAGRAIYCAFLVNDNRNALLAGHGPRSV